MPKAVVLTTRAAWIDADGNRQSADQGAEVELPQAEFDRLRALDAVASPRSKDAKAAAEEAEAEAE
ncbi:MAG: hypothetical protein ACRDY6_13735 [Acidimicrobiia bacterium]